MPRIVERDLNLVDRSTGPLAKFELHVCPHTVPGAPMPSVAVVPLHRLPGAGSVRFKESLGHEFILSKRNRGHLAPRFRCLFQCQPAGETVLTRYCELHVTQRW